MWTHYAHAKDIVVKEGDIVSKGTILGHVGDTGTTPTPGRNGQSHLHFEVHKQNPQIRGFSAYTSGLSIDQVKSLYEDPKTYLRGKIEPLACGKITGWGWLQINNHNQVHPGLDLNVGGGYDDYGLPFVAVEDSRVVKIIYNDGGWGNHIYLEALNNKLTSQQMEELKKMIAGLQSQIDVIKEDVKKLYNRVTIRKEENVDQYKKIKKLKK